LGAFFAMLPIFRTDLSATSIPQEGKEGFDVVDPSTAEVYRFSPSEMFVAQRLDGRRTQAEIMADLQQQAGLSMGLEEFNKFVEQLRAMGLTRAAEQQTEIHLDLAALIPQPGAQAAPVAETTSAVGAPPPLPSVGAPAAEAWRSTPTQAAAQEPATQARAHITEGLAAVHSGQLTRALQCLSRARALVPNDAVLLRLGRAIKKAGPQAPTEQLERLWQLCAELYPQEVSRLSGRQMPPPRPQSGTAGLTEITVPESVQAPAMLLARPPFPKLWRHLQGLRATKTSTWLSAAAVLLVLGSATVAVRYRGGGRSLLHRLLKRPVAVRLQALQAGRMPVYYAGGAKILQLRGDQWLSFGAAGEVQPPLPAVGLKVQAGDLLARLDLTLAQGRTLATAQRARTALLAEQVRLSAYLNALLAERSRAESALELVQKAAGRGSRAEAAVASRLQHLHKQLRGIAQRERQGRAKLARAIDKCDAAQAQWRHVVQRLHRQLLLAPSAGQIMEVRLQAGQKVRSADPVLLLRDRAQLLLTFEVPPGASLERGQAVWVSVQRATPQAATVVHVDQGDAATQIQVTLPFEPDAAATGDSAAAPAAAFRLVKTFVQPTYQVSPLAIVGAPQQPQILLLQRGRVRRLSVKILEAHSGALFIGGLPEDLETNPHLVVGRLDGQPLGALQDGALVTVLPQR
jgi:hypothetical protein